MQKEEVEKQNNLQQLQRLKNKRNPAGSSIKSKINTELGKS